MAASTFTVAQQSQLLLTAARETLRSTQNERDAVEQAGQDMNLTHEKDVLRASPTNTALASMIERIGHQVQVIENININLAQQLQLSQSILCLLQNIEEVNRKSSDRTHEATQSIGELMHLVALLRSSVGTFKLREEFKIVS